MERPFQCRRAENKQRSKKESGKRRKSEEFTCTCWKFLKRKIENVCVYLWRLFILKFSRHVTAAEISLKYVFGTTEKLTFPSGIFG